jgi:hypothetical protein
MKMAHQAERTARAGYDCVRVLIASSRRSSHSPRRCSPVGGRTTHPCRLRCFHSWSTDFARQRCDRVCEGQETTSLRRHVLPGALSSRLALLQTPGVGDGQRRAGRQRGWRPGSPTGRVHLRGRYRTTGFHRYFTHRSFQHMAASRGAQPMVRRAGMALTEHATEALIHRRASGTADLVAVVPRSRLPGPRIRTGGDDGGGGRPVSARLRLSGHRPHR